MPNNNKCPRCGSDEWRSLNEYKEVTLRDGYNRVHYSINKYIFKNNDINPCLMVTKNQV